jgi:hypothetical protein
MSTRKHENTVITENYLDFLEDLHRRGMAISDEHFNLLKKKGRIEDNIPAIKKGVRYLASQDPNTKSRRQQVADEFVDVIDNTGGDIGQKDVFIFDTDTFDKLSDTAAFKYQGDKEISKKDWMPRSTTQHTVDFVRFIDSLNTGIQNLTNYKPFQLYCQQSSDWLAENGSISDYKNGGERREYAVEEQRRGFDNSLYFLDKYLMLKEAALDGITKYASKPVHKIICFLFDCGYSTMLGKGRQIAATSTYGGCAMKKMILNKNFFIKFITEDVLTGAEIFEDKIKYPFGELPDWMKPDVSNDRDNLFKISKKGDKKGSKKGVNSKLQVVAPSISAINGGSPQLVMVDEAGYISILGKMMTQARPTMFGYNPTTEKLEMKRQIIIWGTGGQMDKGGKAYEEAYYDCVDKWNNREFGYGIIPLFFDWTCRPGMTREFYESEKANATTDGPDKEEKMVAFRQTYPSTVADMFLTSAKLLVGVEWLEIQRNRIKTLNHDLRPQKGYFEPVYNTAKPTSEHSHTPFEIVGATFVPIDDIADESRASVTIFQHPKPNWRNRYYTGVDPIASDNGYSNQAGAIFDAHFKTIPAIVNYRENDHLNTFLQTMMLGLYYGAEDLRTPELVEANIGTAYIDYVNISGFRKSMVHRTQLPEYFQGGGNEIGIDNRGTRSKLIISKMFEVFQAFGDRMWIDEIFKQLRTFVCTITANGNETWGVSDKKKYHDDVLYAIVFAYICHLCYEHKPPYEIKEEADKFVMRSRQFRDSNGELYRQDVLVRIHK